MSATTQSVQCFGKKKTATAVAHCKVRTERIEEPRRREDSKVQSGTRSNPMGNENGNLLGENAVRIGCRADSGLDFGKLRHG